jgi:hypothetical protein
LICSDFWKNGAGKIQVVPSVQVAYERDVALETETLMQETKKTLGWVEGVPPLRRGQSDEQAIRWKERYVETGLINNKCNADLRTYYQTPSQGPLQPLA